MNIFFKFLWSRDGEGQNLKFIYIILSFDPHRLTKEEIKKYGTYTSQYIIKRFVLVLKTFYIF